MPETVRVILDVRPAHNIDPGPLFERIKLLLEQGDEFDIVEGQAYVLFQSAEDSAKAWCEALARAMAAQNA